MKALSIKQPWATLILLGRKDIENRNWRIGRNDRHGPTSGCTANFRIELPTRIYVHASKKYDRGCLEFLWKRGLNIMDTLLLEPYLKQHGCMGAIVGEVDIIDCITESDSPWFVGKYGFVLSNPMVYPEPIPYTGRLGFFEVTIPKPDIPGKYLCKKCFPQGVNPNMARDTTSKAQEH